MKVVGYRIKAKEFKGGLAVDQDFPAAAERALCAELTKGQRFALVHGGPGVAAQIWEACRMSIESGTLAVLFFGEEIVSVPKPMGDSPFVRALSYRVFKGADPQPFLRLLAYVRNVEQLPGEAELEGMWELVSPGKETQKQSAIEDLYPIMLSAFAGATSLTSEQQAVIKLHQDVLGECSDIQTLQKKFERLIPWQDRRSHLSHNEFGHRFRLILERPSNQAVLTAFLDGSCALPEHLRTLLNRWPRVAADFDRLFEAPCEEMIEEPSDDQRRKIEDGVDAARRQLRKLSEIVDEVRKFDGLKRQAGGPDLLDILLAECRKFADSVEKLRQIA